jgi:hypothetical protein
MFCWRFYWRFNNLPQSLFRETNLLLFVATLYCKYFLHILIHSINGRFYSGYFSWCYNSSVRFASFRRRKLAQRQSNCILFRVSIKQNKVLIKYRMLTYETFEEFKEDVIFVQPTTMFLISMVEGKKLYRRCVEPNSDEIQWFVSEVTSYWFPIQSRLMPVVMDSIIWWFQASDTDFRCTWLGGRTQSTRIGIKEVHLLAYQ